jgi:dienelactone hydrolase
MPTRRTMLTALLSALPALALAAGPEPVTFPAADRVTVHADLYRPTGTPRGVVLLFHQAGSSRLEYSSIAPRLAGLGWMALAVDARSGGSLFGERNLTAAGLRGDPGYMAAFADLEAALAFSRQNWPGVRPVAWGSSYSAALVFLLAAKHPAGIAAVVAFSPGEYLPVPVRAAAAQVKVPVYVTSAADSEEESAAATLLAASPATVKRQYRARSGIHGSATLRPDSNPAGAEANFADVAAFLSALPAQPR